jgi:hypothetical protein
LIDVVFLKATGNQRRKLVARVGQTCYVGYEKSCAAYATAILSYKDLVLLL